MEKQDQEIAEIIQSFFTTRLQCRVPHSCFADDPAREQLEKLPTNKLSEVAAQIEQVYKQHGDSIINYEQAIHTRKQFAMERIRAAFQIWLRDHGIQLSTVISRFDWPTQLVAYFKKR